jgi:hypothetical protein
MRDAQTADAVLPIQEQLEAYNARDIDAFMRWWADELPVRCVSIPSSGGWRFSNSCPTHRSLQRTEPFGQAAIADQFGERRD